MNERSFRSIPIGVALATLLLPTTACDAWFGPGEGDAPHSTYVSGITVVEDGCCGADVRIDGGRIVHFNGSYHVDVGSGKHTVATRECTGLCRPGVENPGCRCSSTWSFCTVTIGSGGYATVGAGGC